MHSREEKPGDGLTGELAMCGSCWQLLGPVRQVVINLRAPLAGTETPIRKQAELCPKGRARGYMWWRKERAGEQG